MWIKASISQRGRNVFPRGRNAKWRSNKYREKQRGEIMDLGGSQASYIGWW